MVMKILNRATASMCYLVDEIGLPAFFFILFGVLVSVGVFTVATYNDSKNDNKLEQAELIAWHKGYEYGRFETILKFQEVLPESTFVELATVAQDGLSVRELRYLKVIPKVERKVLIP